jgi:hypothetical protein
VTAASTGDLLVALSALPLGVSIVSMFRRNGTLMEWSGSAAAIRGVRVRGTAFLVGLLMLGTGLALGLTQGDREGSMVVGAVSLVALVAFALYRPRTVDVEQTSRRHQLPRSFIEPSSRWLWLAAFTCSALASIVLIVGAIL